MAQPDLNLTWPNLIWEVQTVDLAWLFLVKGSSGAWNGNIMDILILVIRLCIIMLISASATHDVKLECELNSPAEL